MIKITIKAIILSIKNFDFKSFFKLCNLKKNSEFLSCLDCLKDEKAIIIKRKK